MQEILIALVIYFTIGLLYSGFSYFKLSKALRKKMNENPNIDPSSTAVSMGCFGLPLVAFMGMFWTFFLTIQIAAKLSKKTQGDTKNENI